MIQLRPGDILAYRDNPELWARGIALGEQLAGADPKFVHIGIWTGDGEIAAYPDGVQSGGRLPYPCDVLRPQADAFNRAWAVQWLLGKVGMTPYAWWDLVWVWLVRRLGRRRFLDWADRTVICSELGAEFLRRCGLNPFPNLYDCEVMPGDYDGAPGLVNLGTLPS